MISKPRTTRTQRIIVALMAVAVLVPSLYGFGTKFLEFIALYRGDVDGVFAITPILNYLLASLGFLCLFGWAALDGMFHDVERPKQAMLENEARLDACALGVVSTARHSTANRPGKRAPVARQSPEELL